MLVLPQGCPKRFWVVRHPFEQAALFLRQARSRNIFHTKPGSFSTYCQERTNHMHLVASAQLCGENIATENAMLFASRRPVAGATVSQRLLHQMYEAASGDPRGETNVYTSASSAWWSTLSCQLFFYWPHSSGIPSSLMYLAARVFLRRDRTFNSFLSGCYQTHTGAEQVKTALRQPCEYLDFYCCVPRPGTSLTFPEGRFWCPQRSKITNMPCFYYLWC